MIENTKISLEHVEQQHKLATRNHPVGERGEGGGSPIKMTGVIVVQFRDQIET